LTMLLNEYKNRIDQNSSLLKSRSSVELKHTSNSTAKSAKPPINKQFERYEKNVDKHRHNFNSSSKECETMRTDEESLKNARQEIN
jgi:hypothetical protein